MAARILAIVLGLLAALGGVATAGLGVAAAILSDSERDRFALGASLIPSGVLLLGVGVGLVWLAARALRGRAASPVGLPPWWFSAAVTPIAIGVGWAALEQEWWWLFFPFATLAVFAPVALIGWLGLPRRGPRPTWRRILPAFAWGALVAPTLAIAVEAVGVAAGGLAALLGLAASGDAALDTVRLTVERLQGRTLTDAQQQALIRLLLRQPVVLALGAFVLSFVAPVAEEGAKFLAVVLFGRRLDSALAIFLLGLAAGLGFATIENVFYATQSGADAWPLMAGMRAATPVMHGTASALFALGWARQARDPRGWGLLRGALAAFGLHGAWNFLGGVVMVGALLTAGTDAELLGGALVVALVGLLIALGLFSAWTLYRLGRALGREAEAEAAPAAGPAPPPPPATIPPHGAPAPPRPEPARTA